MIWLPGGVGKSKFDVSVSGAGMTSNENVPRHASYVAVEPTARAHTCTKYGVPASIVFGVHVYVFVCE
jgi:hypothetical protein